MDHDGKGTRRQVTGGMPVGEVSRIGAKFHEDPQVLHYGKGGTGPKLEPGMIFTIEPMINAGKAAIREMADGWTIVTKDRSLSAQWEHTVLVTETGYEVMTLSAGGRAKPDWIN